MGISEMTYMSYFFTVMAVVFGGISIAMYFMFHIRRCWRIAWGAHSVTVRENVPYAIVSNTAPKDHSQIREKTEKLTPDPTEALLTLEETVTLETMTLVQDIVMMDIGNCVNS